VRRLLAIASTSAGARGRREGTRRTRQTERVRPLSPLYGESRVLRKQQSETALGVLKIEKITPKGTRFPRLGPCPKRTLKRERQGKAGEKRTRGGSFRYREGGSQMREAAADRPLTRVSGLRLRGRYFHQTLKGLTHLRRWS